MNDPYAAEFQKWSQLQPTVVRTVFALHLAEAILPPSDTLQTVLDVWCCPPPPPPATEVRSYQVDLTEYYGRGYNYDM